MPRPKTLQPKTCPVCTTEFQPKNSAVKFCSVACKNVGITKVRPIKECPVCKVIFVTRWDRQVCCSQSCARALDARVHGPKNWKGGVNKHPAGYLKEQRKGHPLADRNGYVMQHRLVMEEVLGRQLEVHERVHHKNGVRDDNRPENLELWTTKHKDPAGVRQVDHVRFLLSQLSAEDRAYVIGGADK